MNRKEEREWVIKLIYQNQYNSIDSDSLSDILADQNIKSKFVHESIQSILENIDSIDKIISDNLTKATMNSLLAIEKAILRVSINEFLIAKSVPRSVSINEAVENAKKFGNDDSYKLVNGILSAVARKEDEKSN